MVAQMEPSRPQVPPEMKKGFDLLLRGRAERLAELEKAGRSEEPTMTQIRKPTAPRRPRRPRPPRNGSSPSRRRAAIPAQPGQARLQAVRLPAARRQGPTGRVLKSGPVAYVAEDRELPLVTVTVTLRGGSYLDPAGKEGLADLAGYLLRRGGTKAMTAEQLEERLAFLAAQPQLLRSATTAARSA